LIKVGFEDGGVAKSYRPVLRDQGFLLPPDMREWLPADDPVFLVIDIIENHLDTSAFHRLRRTGGVGRAGYDPDMLLTLLVWGWMQGVRSSRQLERACSRDVSYRLICGGDAPDHVTIARFRGEGGEAVQQLFVEVLLLCRRLGLGQVGMVALDGTKIGSPASREANRDRDGLRREQEREAARQAARAADREHAAADAADDVRFGSRRGDEPPQDGGGSRSRSERIAAALADVQAEEEQAAATAAERAAQREARVASHGGRVPEGQEVVLAERALASARAERVERVRAWQASGGRGRHPCPNGIDQAYEVRRALARLERARQTVARRQTGSGSRRGPVRNITDPESGLQPVRGGGWIQGYNAQVVATSDGLVLATSLSSSPSDRAAFGTVMQRACAAAEQIGAGPVGLLLADAGYLSVENLTMAGPDRLIAVGNRRNLEHAARDSSPPAAAGRGVNAEITAMRERLQTEDAMTAYRQRGRIVETIFGHHKHNWKFTRFTGTGRRRAESEWAFHGAVHNLAKAVSKMSTQPAT
jgi:transposase